MSDYHGTFQHFKNSDSSFTELLSILVKYDFYSDDAPSLEYNTAELKIICQHINNASDILLQGI